jgi:hypothetical protein
VGVVTYLSLSKHDVISTRATDQASEAKEKGGLWQTAVVVALFIVLGGTGYFVRHSALQSDASGSPTTLGSGTSTLGDLSTFKTITQDTLDKLNAGDQSGATTRIGDLEYEWDKAASRLKATDQTGWTKIDGKIDTVLRELRAVNPNPVTEKTALQELLVALQ